MRVTPFSPNRRDESILPDIIHVHVTVCPSTFHEGPEGEQMYIYTLSLTSALDGGVWTMPRLSHFALGKDPVPLYTMLVGPQGWSGRVRKD